MSMLTNIWHVLKTSPNYVSFLLISPIILYFNLNTFDFVFYYDSLGYWTHSGEFIKNGMFSFHNYDLPLRSYLFSFLIGIIKVIARSINLSSYVFYEMVISLVYSFMITVVLPDIVYRLFGKKVGVLQILVFSFLALYFWRGYFFYPLTDLPAFLLVLLGVWILVRFQKEWWIGLLTGCVWGGAVLFRPSYQMSLLPLLVWAWYFYHKEIHLSAQNVAARVLTILAGMILVFGPQIAINLHNYGIFSPFAQTQLYYKYKGNDLFSVQLGWGLNVQKYETNIGSTYPIAEVRFLDPHGENILIRAGYKSEPYSTSGKIGPDTPLKLGQYIELIGQYPLDFLSIYARHFFNGLDIRYDTVYISDIYIKKLLFRLTNYTIWFLVLVYLTRKAWERKISWSNSRFLLPVIFALPALLSVPTAVEVRYMLPLYFMAYALVAFWVLPQFFALDTTGKKKILFKYLLWYSCFIVLCFMLSSNTYMHLEYGT